MSDIKIGQIWSHNNETDQCLRLFKVNKISDYSVYGIIVADSINEKLIGYTANYGKCWFDDKVNFKTFNFKLIQDVIGKNCWNCNIFYNGVETNNCIKKFICWECDIRHPRYWT